MKYAVLIFAIVIVSCNTPKKSVKKEEVKEVVTETPKNIEGELLVVLKNPNAFEDAKALVTNSGLSWEKLLFDQNDLKIALIKVPADKSDFWVKRLLESGEFKSVEKNQLGTYDNIKNEAENTLLTFRKTACLGDCPVYEMQITKDGKVTFDGANYTLKEGKTTFQLSDKELKNLLNKLEKTTFSEYDDTYDNPRLTDIPSTFITYNNKQIKVRLWKNVPDTLTDVTEYLETILLAQKLIE